MDLHQAVTQRRTLVIEGCAGVRTSGLTDQLTRHHGFAVRRAPPDPHPADPTAPYYEALREPGRLVFAPGLVGELVYGPLRRGRSRVTWIQAFDLAEAVAERDGAFLHLTAPLPVLQRRLAAAQGTPAAGEADHTELAAAVTGYERALRTLAQYAPVLTLDESDLAGDVRIAAPCPCVLGAGQQHRTRPTSTAWPTHPQVPVTDGKLVPLARDVRQENPHGRRPGHPRSAGAVQD